MIFKYGDFISIPILKIGYLQDNSEDQLSGHLATGIVVHPDGQLINGFINGFGALVAFPKNAPYRCWNGDIRDDVFNRTNIPKYIHMQYNFWFCYKKYLTLVEKQYEI